MRKIIWRLYWDYTTASWSRFDKYATYIDDYDNEIIYEQVWGRIYLKAR